jgi:hypothetical protein
MAIEGRRKEVGATRVLAAASARFIYGGAPCTRVRGDDELAQGTGIQRTSLK